MKKAIYKCSIAFPLMMILYSFFELVALSVSELGLYIQPASTRFLIVMFTVLWLCCSPLKKYCCNGTLTELLFNLMPVELVLMFAFAQWYFTIFAVLVLLLITVEVALFVLLRRDERSRCFSQKLHRAYNAALRQYAMLAIVLICSIPCLISFFVHGLQSPIYQAQPEIADQLFPETEKSSDNGMDNPYQTNYRLWSCFQDDNWKRYSINEKITILQQLVDFESDVLGIPTIPVTADFIGELTLGEYSLKTNEMWINTEHLALSPAEDCITTICHEVYHSFQNYLVSTLDWENPAVQTSYFDELRAWLENENDYKGAIWGFDIYESQPLESSARKYAAEETAKIMSYVNK